MAAGIPNGIHSWMIHVTKLPAWQRYFSFRSVAKDGQLITSQIGCYSMITPEPRFRYLEISVSRAEAGQHEVLHDALAKEQHAAAWTLQLCWSS